MTTRADAGGGANNGAIYQPAAYRPVFEDRRARHVGDT
jgi:flagellar L-ring protein precursor FlgH